MIKIVDKDTYALISDTLTAPFVALVSEEVVPKLLQAVGCSREELEELLKIEHSAQAGDADCVVDFVHPNAEYQWGHLVEMLQRDLVRLRRSRQ